MVNWQPIDTYPKDYLEQEETNWGPTVLVYVPPTDEVPWPYGLFVAHLEADEWLARDPDHPECCGPLFGEPTHWAPLTWPDGRPVD